MWRALAVVVAVAGCDNLFKIAPVPIVDGGGGGGGGGDVGVDTMTPCTPTMFNSAPLTLLSMTMVEAAVSEDNSGLAIITGTGTTSLYALAPLASGTVQPTNISNTNTSPGLAPGGVALYVTSNTTVQRFVPINPTTWSGTVVPSLATYKPGAIGVAPDGSWRMVAASETGGLFQELRSTDEGMTWSSFEAPVSSMDLTGDGTMPIESPNLSSDAGNLTYVAVDTMIMPPSYTVRFAHRDDPRIGFKLATVGGPLLAARPKLVESPYLSRDCARLYLVETTLMTSLELFH